MANPTKPAIDYSYSGFQSEQQVSPIPGSQLDNDFAELKRGIDDTIDALADVRRSDGALKNGIVTRDSLSAGVSVTADAMNPDRYDPTGVEGDAFDMDNMVEGDTNLILTAAERTKLAEFPAGVANTVPTRKSDNSGYENVSVGLHAPNLISALSKWNTIWRYMEDEPSVAGTFNAAWAALQTELTAGTTIEIPEASYLLNQQAQWRTDVSQEIVCSGGYGTILTATSALTDGIMFAPANSNATSALRWHGGYLNGGGFASAGIASEKCLHYEIHGIEITGTKLVALRLVGWSGRLTGRFASNLGNGVEAAGLLDGVRGNNNLVYNIVSYANGGYGAYFSDGLGVNMSGSGIEGNKKGGVIAHNFHAFSWYGGYEERNGEDKTTLTSASGFAPEDIAIRAGLFLFRTGRGLFTGAGAGVEGVHIDGVLFDPYGGNDFPEPGLGQDCIVFGDSFENFHFGNANQIREPERYGAVIGAYNHGGYTNFRNVSVDVGSLLRPVKLFGSAGVTAHTPISTMHHVSNRFVDDPTNYAPQTVGDYPDEASGSTGTLTAVSSTYHKGFPVWAVASGDKRWEATLDLTDPSYEGLKGQSVLFIYDYKIRETGSGIRPYIDTQYDSDRDSESAGGWQPASIPFEVDAEATELTFGFMSMGTVTDAPYISALRLVVVGNSATDALRGKTF